MRRLRILTPNKEITDHIESVSKEAVNEIASNGKLSDETISKYNYHPLKEIKIRESSGKCVYCESKILANQPGELDHIIPKAKCISDNKISLVYDFNNLTLSCRTCNSKKSSFGSSSPLLSPYSNRPEHHIRFSGNLPIAITDEGHKTITILELDIRDDLVISIRRRIKEVGELISNYLREKDPEMKTVLKRRIYRETLTDKEYSSAVKSLVKAFEL